MGVTRKVLFVAAALVTAALLLAPVASAGSLKFGGKPSVVGIEAFCVTKGAEQGRVYVDVAVRYFDAKGADDAALHAQVHSHMRILGASGRVLAVDNDWGREQPDIPGLSSFIHTHQHRLGRADSRRILQGRRCTAATSRVIHVEVQLEQRLGTAAKPDAARAARLATASAVATETASSTSAAIVEGVAQAPTDTDGCVFDQKGQMDCAGAFLQNASFVGRRVPYANFSFANMLGADLEGVSLGHVTMNQTVLDQANLRGAELGVASLTSASMVGTDLTGAQLPYANLANAKFVGANVEGANFIGANLYGVHFETTKCNAETRFPTNFRYSCSNGEVVGG
jgi:uncharacterized protein YjbI with pentapeptide repeats